MKHKVKTLKGLKKQIHIQIPPAEVQKVFDKYYQNVKKKAEIHGYRKGKVPLSHIRSLYQQKAGSAVTLDLIQQFYSKAIEETGLKAVTEPELDYPSLAKENQAFHFVATLEIRPSIQIDKNFIPSLSLPPLPVSQQEISQSIENLRKAIAIHEPVTDRPVQWGDVVQLEKQFDDPSEKMSEDTEPVRILLDKADTLSYAIAAPIVGLRLGDMTSLSVGISLPSKIKESEKGGVNRRSINIKITKIEKVFLPDINDDLAQTQGFNSLQDMKDFIRNGHIDKKWVSAHKKLKETTLEQLLKKHPLSFFPENLVENQKQLLISKFVEGMRTLVTSQQIEEHIKTHQKHFQQQAESAIHRLYLMWDIAEVLNIKVSHQEIQEHAQKTKEQKSINKDTEEYYNQKNSILQEKILEHFVHKALPSWRSQKPNVVPNEFIEDD